MRLLPVVAASCLVAAYCGGGPHVTKPQRRAQHRVLVLGFDGMDPTLARKWMDEGKLPNLKRLSEEGTFSTLASTQPSESPVAWSSFATGVNPGKHNIYDFLIRDFQTYFPDFNMVKKEPPEFLFGLIPTKRPRVLSTRGGTSFWVSAGRDGIKSEILTVPVTFPPEEIEHGQMLAGLPLPDIRGTLGTYSYWGTDVSSFEERSASEFLGISKALVFDNGLAETTLKGPDNPILKQEQRRLEQKKKSSGLNEGEKTRLDELETKIPVAVPMTVKWKEGSSETEIEIQGTKTNLKAGEWSPWVPLKFSFNFLVSVRGMVQFYVIRADKELQIYGSPVNMDPRDPPIPISKPDGFSAELASRIGLYRTLGWAEAADKPLNEGRLDEAAFLYDSDRAMEDREKIIYKSLDTSTDWDLFVAVIETTDRVSHMMWRLIDPKHPMYDPELAKKYGDAIEKVYRRADDVVGRVRAKLPNDVILMVVSDHGFHSFRRGVNLNTWLVKNNYMSFSGQEGEKKTLEDLFGRGKFFEGVDWHQTKAYAVGLGQIYFNLKGREGQGIVSSGAEYKALQEEMRQKLLTLTDPENGERVFRDVYRRDDIYKGEYLQNAPDLQVGFNDGYRVGWQDTLGGIARDVVENNNRKWSGDHCATATEISGGVLFANKKILTSQPAIIDVAPTVLKALGVSIPDDYDGKPFM